MKLRPMDREATLDQVLDQVASGNVDAFRWIIRQYELPLRSYLCSQVYDLDVVDDLAQEVFIAAYRSLDSFQRGQDFGRWLRGIARLKLQMYFRATARRQKAMERFRQEMVRLVEEELEQEAARHQAAAIEALLRCISRLPEKLRRVVRAGLDGTKPALLAQALSTSVGAVYNLHYRANQLLRECVRKELAHG